MFPADCEGLIPTPSFVIMADVAAGTLNSSAANFSTAVNGVDSGTDNTLNGSLGSLVRVILNVTLLPLLATGAFSAIITYESKAIMNCEWSYQTRLFSRRTHLGHFCHNALLAGIEAQPVMNSVFHCSFFTATGVIVVGGGRSSTISRHNEAQ